MPRKMRIISQTVSGARKSRGGKKRMPDRDPTPEPEPDPTADPVSSPASSMVVDDLAGSLSPLSGPEEEESTAQHWRKKQRQKPELTLTDDQEVVLSEWLLEHPAIFTKGYREFRDSQKKNRLWAEKAVEFDCTIYYKSTCTKVGKVTHTKSGQSATPKSDRNLFLMRHFGFLEEHIVRMPSRTAVSLKNKVAASEPAPPPEGDSSSELEQLPEPRAEPSADPEPEPEDQQPQCWKRSTPSRPTTPASRVISARCWSQSTSAPSQCGAPGWGRRLKRWQKPAKRPLLEKPLRSCKG